MAEALEIPCCPDLTEDERCDVFTYDYRFVHNTVIEGERGTRRIPVEVKLRIRVERCSGPLTLGDLVYSTTLLPGEVVRLFTMDRRSRFTFDTESQVSYRHEQTSEESYYAKSMAFALSSFRSREDIDSVQTSSGAWSGSGKASGYFAGIFGGASAKVSGNHSATSTLDFARELSGYATSMHNTAVSAVREASAVQVGEVASRTHAEGESESHLESSSRVISNPNKCRAVTYLFHQINRTMTVRFSFERVSRRVVDPAADTELDLVPPTVSGEVHTIPQGVLATDRDRLEVETIGREAASAQRVSVAGSGPSTVARGTFAARSAVIVNEPLTAAEHEAALAAIDRQLAERGITTEQVDEPGEELTRLAFERTTSLPTPGILVRACLDECDACEPERHREIELDLERKELENKLLARRVELLEESQEYRCCPEHGHRDDHGRRDEDEPGRRRRDHG